MAFSLNRAQIIGNVTRDPEIRQTQNGTSVASFGVATNFSWTDQGGQKQEKVEFHNVVAWRRLAEICGQYLKKGRKVYVEGRLQTRDWQGEDGIKRYRTEIIADQIILLDRKEEGGTYTSGMKSVPAERQTPINNYMQNRPMSGPLSSTAPEASVEAAPVTPAVEPEPPAPVPGQEEEKEVTLDDLPF